MKFLNRDYWIKSGSYSLITNLQSLLFGFGGFYLLVRTLDKDSFGVWVLFAATTTIFDMARSGLIQNALIKFLSHSPESESNDILSASFFLSGILMVLCIIVNISLANYFANLWHFPALVQMFYAYNIVYVLQGALSQFQWIEQARLSFKGILVTNVIKQGGFFFYILTCYLFHINISLMNLVYAQAVCAFVGAMVEYFFVRKYLSFSFKLNTGWIKQLFNYGKFAFGTSISAILAPTVTQMMLGALLSPVATGGYNIAMRITSLAAVPSSVIGAIVFPQSSKRFATEGSDAIKYLYEKSVGAILAILIPGLLFIFLFPSFVVHVIAGANYPETISVTRLVMISCISAPFARQFGTILDSIGMAKINFIFILFSTAAEWTVGYIMINKYGLIGAAYGTLIVDSSILIAIQIILNKKLGVNILNSFIYAIRFYPEFFNKYIRPIDKSQDETHNV